MIFTKNDESFESLHSKWRKLNDKMQTQENNILMSASNVNQSINISSELKYDNSSLKKNKIINLHWDSTNQVKQHEATVSSSSQQMKSQQMKSQQMKSQQNTMIFDCLVTEDLARESD